MNATENGVNPTLTHSAWSPRFGYSGLVFVPPAYPTEVRSTPGRHPKAASDRQKLPRAKTATLRGWVAWRRPDSGIRSENRMATAGCAKTPKRRRSPRRKKSQLGRSIRFRRGGETGRDRDRRPGVWFLVAAEEMETWGEGAIRCLKFGMLSRRIYRTVIRLRRELYTRWDYRKIFFSTYT